MVAITTSSNYQGVTVHITEGMQFVRMMFVYTQVSGSWRFQAQALTNFYSASAVLNNRLYVTINRVAPWHVYMVDIRFHGFATAGVNARYGQVEIDVTIRKELQSDGYTVTQTLLSTWADNPQIGFNMNTVNAYPGAMFGNVYISAGYEYPNHLAYISPYHTRWGGEQTYSSTGGNYPTSGIYALKNNSYLPQEGPLLDGDNWWRIRDVVYWGYAYSQPNPNAYITFYTESQPPYTYTYALAVDSIFSGPDNPTPATMTVNIWRYGTNPSNVVGTATYDIDWPVDSEGFPTRNYPIISLSNVTVTTQYPYMFPSAAQAAVPQTVPYNDFDPQYLIPRFWRGNPYYQEVYTILPFDTTFDFATGTVGLINIADYVQDPSLLAPIVEDLTIGYDNASIGNARFSELYEIGGYYINAPTTIRQYRDVHLTQTINTATGVLDPDAGTFTMVDNPATAMWQEQGQITNAWHSLAPTAQLSDVKIYADYKTVTTGGFTYTPAVNHCIHPWKREHVPIKVVPATGVAPLDAHLEIKGLWPSIFTWMPDTEWSTTLPIQ